MSTDEPIAKTDWKFVVGSVLSVFNAFLIGAIHVGVLYMFGIPLILLATGLIFLIFSGAAMRTKAVIALVTLAIVPATFVTSMYLGSAESELFLIPENHRGEFVVFYGEPCGGEPVYENGERIYAIGNDGVLITRAERNDGYLKRRFFTVNESGERSGIPEFHRQSFESEKSEWNLMYQPLPVESFTRDTVGVFWGYGTSSPEVSTDSIPYRVGSYNDRASASFRDSEAFAEMTRQKLQSCREKVR